MNRRSLANGGVLSLHVGWRFGSSGSSTLHAAIATDALTMAVKRRAPPIGLLHQDDRGVPSAHHAHHARHAYREPLAMPYAKHEPRRQLLRQRHYRKLSIESLWIENLCIESLRATLKHPGPQPANQNPRLTHLRQRKRSRRPSESERIVRCVHDARVSPVPANSRPEMASI